MTNICVVIPAFRAADTIVEVVNGALDQAQHVIVVDDFCPDASGQVASKEFSKDKRVTILFNQKNLGVGGATKRGLAHAMIMDEAPEVIVKMDSDGQMDPANIPSLIEQVANGNADFAKGNRFSSPEDLERMPLLRLLGNAVLSLMSKISSGYWSVSDPTNGYIAFSQSLLARLQLEKIADTYFFESDLLFRLRLIRAKISEVPMKAIYFHSGQSSLRPFRVAIPFLFAHTKNWFKRYVYLFVLREWSLASFLFPLGLFSTLFGGFVGISGFFSSQQQGVETPVGTIFLTTILLILGVQFLLQFSSEDMRNEPKVIN